VELAAYRIVQEALTNTLKHAGPAHARVRMTRPPGAVEIEVIDNGRGPRTAPSGPDGPGVDGPGSQPPRSQGPVAGHGLIGMRERVAVYAGELVTGAAPGGGFRVWARFPLPGTAAKDGDDPRPEPAWSGWWSPTTRCWSVAASR
jgi:signal transduction histidine kinase